MWLMKNTHCFPCLWKTLQRNVSGSTFDVIDRVFWICMSFDVLLSSRYWYWQNVKYYVVSILKLEHSACQIRLCEIVLNKNKRIKYWRACHYGQANVCWFDSLVEVISPRRMSLSSWMYVWNSLYKNLCLSTVWAWIWNTYVATLI